MKKLCTVVLSLTLLVGCLFLLPVESKAATVEDLTYEIWEGEVTITGCDTAASGDLIIPDTIEGYPVTRIGEWAFWNCSSLTGITIPDSVTGIGSSAFYYCSSLASITIPDSVTSIGDSAFEGCTGLTSISIGNGVTSISDYAFAYCTGLTSITIPDSVTGIDYYAFRGCTGLTSISIGSGVTSISDYAFAYCTGLTGIWVSPSNANYCSDEKGVLFNKSMTELVSAPACISGDYAIPDSVTIIGDDAFYNCSGLTSITIPDSVTDIGGRAFYGCSSLTSVTIPDGVSIISGNTFAYCTSLTSITIGSGITDIGDHVFNGSENLTDVYISDANAWCKIMFGNFSVSNPMTYADHLHILDENGEEVTEITLDSSVTAIPDYAFKGSTITSITIPDSVTSIGGSAFEGCTGLTNITIPDSVTAIGGWVFDGCTGLTSVTIPDGVTGIEMYAFSGCSSLTSVTIPESVTRIDYRAFSDCNSLTDVYYSGTADQWDDIYIVDDNEAFTNATIHYQCVELFSIAGVNLALNNDITLYMYVMAENYDPSYTMEITKSYADGTSVTNTVAAADWESYYGTMYRVGFNGIAAKEMTDEITVTVYDASGNAVSKEFVTTVADAAVLVYKSEANAASFTMMADLLNYGAAAQGNFRYNTDDLANTRLTAEQAAYASARFDMSTVTGKATGTTGAMGATLYLNTNIQHNFIFDAAVVDSTMTAKVSYTNYKGVANSFTIPGSR
ncbi:MAG: leucine-rich repeat domain-containing protein, partial [Oscillospiraceae bacterium]|nr:leucine-rich repeat domain-containing protein [Oscillospiraceae bacterium]